MPGPIPPPFYNQESVDNFDVLVAEITKGNVTALIGAGLSAQAGLPSWSGLLRTLYSRSTLSEEPYAPSLAPRRMEELQRDMGFAFLPVLKDILQPPGLHLPQSYKTVAAIPFSDYATTNIDDLLFVMAALEKNASIDDFWIYRTQEKKHKRFHYLHGRLFSATGNDDLVLAAGAYREAYRNDVHLVRSALTMLLQEPVLFIGSSLADPELEYLLGLLEVSRLQNESSGGRLTSIYRGGERHFALMPANLEDFLPLGFLPPPSLNQREPFQDRLSQLINAKTQELRGKGIRCIWYRYDARHSGLSELLTRIERKTSVISVTNDGFLAAATEIEDLAGRTLLEPAIVERALLLLRSLANRRHFFRYASASWFELLWERGEFAVFDEPQSDGAGNYHVTGWDAADYFQKFAGQFPEVTLRILQERHTENWLAVDAFARALNTLPTQYVLETFPAIDRWLTSQYVAASFVSYHLLALLGRVLNEEQWDISLVLFGVLHKWQQETPTSSTKPRLRDSSYRELLLDYAPRLSKHRPGELTAILVEMVRRLLADEEQSPLFFHRSAVEDTDQDSLGHPSDQLIVGLRGTLVDLADSHRDSAVPLLNEYLSGEVNLLRRLALYVLTERPDLLLSVDERYILPHATYNYDTYHEEMRLLQNCFDELPQRVKDNIHTLIGSTDIPAISLAKDDSPRDEKILRAWHILNVLKDDVLTQDERNKRLALNNLMGQPDRPLFLAWFSGPQWARSPASAEELFTIHRDGGISRLLDALRNPDRFFDVQWMHGRDLLWGELATLIAEEPTPFLPLAEAITRSDFPGAWYYFNAYGKAAEAGKVFDWFPILEASGRLLDEADAPQLHWSLAHMIRDLAASSVPASEGAFDMLWNQAVRLLDQSATPFEQIGATIHDDLTTHQLNAPAGAAADALFNLFRREAATASGTGRPSPELGWVTQRLLSQIDVSCGTGWGGIEFRYAVGGNFSLICQADSSFVDVVLTRLLPPIPTTPADRGAWTSFWDGHLYPRSILADVENILRPYYPTLIADATLAQPAILVKIFRGLDALGERLAVGWLRGYSGFDRVGLFGSFYMSVSEEIRASLVRMLASAVNEGVRGSDPALGERIVRQLTTFWTDRCRQLSNELNDEQPSKELTAFIDWLDAGKFNIDSVHQNLEVMIDHLELDHEADTLIEYFVAVAAIQPTVTAQLLYRLVDRFKTSPSLIWYVHDMPQLLQTLWQGSPDEPTKTVIRSVVSIFLEHFGADYRSSLSDSREA